MVRSNIVKFVKMCYQRYSKDAFPEFFFNITITNMLMDINTVINGFENQTEAILRL